MAEEKKKATTAKKTGTAQKRSTTAKTSPLTKEEPIKEKVIAKATRDTETEKTDREAELRAQIARLQAELQEKNSPIIQVMQDTEKIVMRFQAEIADDNRAVFGPDGRYGEVTGKTGIITVPKSEWSRFYTESMRNMINNRWLIVLSGMTEDERDAYNCNYKEGELIDETAFRKLLDMGRELIAVYPKLCLSHKEMIARRFITAWEQGDERVRDRELVVALNELSKEDYKNAPKADVRRKGLFVPIIRALNAEELE